MCTSRQSQEMAPGYDEGGRPRKFPTPSAEWVREGDACVSTHGMRGRVLRVMNDSSLPTAKVEWENGHVGRVSITTIRRPELTTSQLVDRFLQRDIEADGRFDGCDDKLRAELVEEQCAIHATICALVSHASQ